MILGAGVIGVTSAYALARAGHRVTLLDRREEPAAETSHANGGQLSYSHAEPWASPSLLPKLPGWLLRPDAPLKFRFRADPALWRWCLEFLACCTPAAKKRNTLLTLALALESRRVMAEWIAETGLEFGLTSHGVLHIYRSPALLDKARKQAEFQAAHGTVFRLLSAAECREHEPALDAVAGELAGGILFSLDQTACSAAFTRALLAYLQQRHDIDFKGDVSIDRIAAENGRVTALTMGEQRFTADHYVLATGSYAPLLLRPLGLHAPIYPLKGYSVTLPLRDPAHALRGSITDNERKIVYTRLGNSLRVAGTAEVAGYDLTPDPLRLRVLHEEAERLFPGQIDGEPSEEWSCLRACTPSGQPIIGPAPGYGNLSFNLGHSHLGWTLACGSATRLAASIPPL